MLLNFLLVDENFYYISSMIQNKHIIRLSFIGLFISILANIVLYHYFMIEEIIVKPAAEQNFKVAEIYKKRIWDRDTHSSAISKLKESSYTNWIRDQDFISFAKNSSDFFSNTINSKISLLIQDERVITSDNFNIVTSEHDSNKSIFTKLFTKIDRYLLRNTILNNALNSANEGKTAEMLELNAVITDNKNQQLTKSFMISYIPIINSNHEDPVDGVIEIYTDITKQLENILYLEKRVFIIFIVISSIFFGVVMYNTNYAQRIINQQSETNRSLKEAKIRAETESIAKTEFLANVSHELRTPLNAIIGFSEIMLTEPYGQIENVQYREYIQDINNSGRHLLSVINDILDFSKASADRLKVEHIELDLNKLASSSMRFIKPRADSAKIQLIEKLPKGHIIIKADPKRLKQALLNLISNSVKFTPENGAITLVVEKDELNRLVYIKVIDTGIGMNEKDIPKALSSFGQIDNKLNRKYDGTGLGLPLTKKLVELMQGEFDIQSMIGFGTTVTLTFKYEPEIQV